MSPPLADALEATLHDLLPRLLPAPPVGQRGRPPILPATLLWSALLVGILRGEPSQRALWRQITLAGLWDFPQVAVSDTAVRQRLRHDGPTVLARLFTDLTADVAARTTPVGDLAPLASDIVVLDESTLDPVARLLPSLRGVPNGDAALLPGTLAGVFDVRRQLWRTIVLRDDPHQNEKVLARDLVADLLPGTLVLADLGYFGFAWFDHLTERRLWWLSRQRHKTSVTVMHTFLAQPDRRDQLVWLGRHRADQAAHLVRLLEYRDGQGRWHTYLTNVRDPDALSLEEAVMLYGRRWDIELAVKLVKRELGLHLLWGSRWEGVQTQVWGVLILAQLALGLRRQVAQVAGVLDDDVSLRLLLHDLPWLVRSGATGVDVLGFLAAEGPRVGYVRSARRVVRTVPTATQPWQPPPAGLVTIRPARYAGRRCGPAGTDRRPATLMTN